MVSYTSGYPQDGVGRCEYTWGPGPAREYVGTPGPVLPSPIFTVNKSPPPVRPVIRSAPLVGGTGNCDRFPGCGCTKARWAQGCHRCGVEIQAENCIVSDRNAKPGWRHTKCPSEGPPSVSGLGGVGRVAHAEDRYVVLDWGYAPVGIYLRAEVLEQKVRSSSRFPPSREDRHVSFPVSSVEEAVNAYFAHRPEDTCVALYR